MRVALLVLLISALGCASVCGDGTCTTEETPTCCPEDCMCSSSPDNCDEGFVCVRGHCAVAFPRLYAFTNVEVSVPPLTPGGNEWDPGGGAPDLFLAGETGDPPLFSPVVPDVFMVTFPGPLEIPLAGVPLGADVGVWDADPPGPEGAFVCRYPNTGFDPRARMFICQGTIGGLTATIEPL